MTTSTLIGIILIAIFMGVMVVLDIKDKKRMSDIFDDDDFDK